MWRFPLYTPAWLSSNNLCEVISDTDFFFDTLTIQNDQISYVKHVLAPLYVFFTLFGWGGGPKGSRAQLAVFQPRQLKNGCPSPLFEVLCQRQ